MSWSGKQHPVETAVEWLAPIPLALAIGWAGLRLGFATVVALALGVVALVAGCAVVRMGGRGRTAPLPAFEPTEFESVEPDELLLEEKDAVLELSDRLVEVQPDSRVVRLFERADPTPGELVDRIVDFLGTGHRPLRSNEPADAGGPPDATAALHDALANIRASLR